jgi:hypothetical protein
MKKIIVLVGVFLVCLMPLAASAYSIVISNDAIGNEYISPYAGVTTETFAAGTVGTVGTGLLWNWAGNGIIRAGTISNSQTAPPMGALSLPDASQYYSVPQNVAASPQSVLVTTAPNLAVPHAHYNYFGLWWGSIDSYNTLSWYNDGALVAVATVVGNQITAPVGGPANQTLAANNVYVNFLNLPEFDSFGIQSTQYAMEVDNIAIGVVPEPTTMLLLGLGLVGLARVSRKFRK